VKVPIENVLGEIGRGHVVALNTLNIARFKLAAAILGVAKVLIAEGVKYAKSRVQFGRPICEFGLIKHKIGEMVIKAYAAESMIYRTAGLIDLALDETDPADEDAGRRTGEVLRTYALECAINKVFSSEMLDYVADECVQIMGGYGYIRGNLVESAYRDARINRIWDGTSEINRLTIANQILNDFKKGDLPLLDAPKEEGERIEGIQGKEGPLQSERTMVVRAKKIFLLGFDAAVEKFGDSLQDEQEISGLLADIIIEIFAMESAFLRTLKRIAKEGEEKIRTPIATAIVYINDSLTKISIMARQILVRSCEKKLLTSQLAALTGLTECIPTDTIALRRQIAESIILAGRYHLTRG